MMATSPNLPRPDIYLDWARATRFRDAGGEPNDSDRWLWLLIELHEGQSAKAFAELAAKYAEAWIRLPSHYRWPPDDLAGSRYCSAIVSKSFLGCLTGDALPAGAVGGPLFQLIECIERFEIGFSTAPFLPPAQPPSKFAPPPKNVEVVVGIVDDGLAFANRRFCTEKGKRRETRMLALWDQGADTPRGGSGFGRVHDRRDLDSWLDGARTPAGVDEDLAYALAGYREVAHRVTHGTHVMDLACGADPDDRSAFAPAIVAVQLPGAVFTDTSCASTAVFLLDGVRFVLAQAHRLAMPVPIVVNISLGNIAGPHDGSSIFESALDELLTLRGPKELRIVLPEGNSYLSRCHAVADLDTALPGHDQVEVNLRWLIQPGDGTPSFLELWFSKLGSPLTASDRLEISVEVTAPDGRGLKVDRGKAKDTLVSVSSDREVIAMLSGMCFAANGDNVVVLLAIAPTGPSKLWPDVSPGGVWTVAVDYAGTPYLLKAYVQRDDVAFGRRGAGRQSHFEDPDDLEFDNHGALAVTDQAGAFTRRIGTINGLATGTFVDVAGSAIRHSNTRRTAAPAPYSAVADPDASVTTPGTRRRELAITEESLVLKGVLATGTRSGSLAALSGTSMAAPQLTRSIAKQLVNWPPGSANKLADHAGERRRLLPMEDDNLERSKRRRGVS